MSLFRRFGLAAPLVLLWALAALGCASQARPRDDHQAAPIIDSAMTRAQAMDGLNPACPPEVGARQKLLTVRYYSFDGRLHQGQLVIDGELEADIRAVFAAALAVHFPIHSVIPISDPRFRKGGRWDDDLSMEANNTSGFNYRAVTGGTRLSRHAFGRAIDINPVQNPYIKGDLVLPPGAKYEPATAPGTLGAGHPVVRAFVERGWRWGGDWATRKDYQHFEKPAAGQ